MNQAIVEERNPASLKSRGRLLFLIDGLGRGGAERLMVPYLSHLDRAGFETRVCALDVRHGNPIAAELGALGIPVDLQPVGKLRNVREIARLAAYLAHQRPDVVHTQLEASNILGPLVARCLGVPVLTTLHTIDAPNDARTSRRIALMHRILKRFTRRVVCVSEGVRRHQIERFGFPAELALTLHNGIDLSPFNRVEPERLRRLRLEWGVPASASLIVTVAVLREPKGIQDMIAALPPILEAVPEARYLVVGDGPHRDALISETRRRSVADRVIFAGHRSDIPEILSASDLFVLPTHDDALPTVLAEAMAARLPIVATTVGGVPEMARPGVNALLVPPGNPAGLAGACRDLLTDPSRARALGQAGRRIAEQHFNVTVQAERLSRLYDELIAQRARL